VGRWDAALDHLVGALSIKPNDTTARERRRLYLQQKELLAVQGERDEKAAALRRSEGMRLATESARLLERNPGLALLLAIESSERYPGLVANNAMASALEVCRELKTIAYRRYPFLPELQYLDSIKRRSADFGLGGGRLLTTCYDNTPRIWDSVTGEELVLLGGLDGRPGDIYPTAFGVCSPDGKHIAAPGRTDRPDGTSTAFLFDAESGAIIRELSTGGSIVDVVAFNPDGRFVAAGTREPAARIWDGRTGEPRAVCRGHKGGYTWGLGFSPDGNLLAAASDDRTARIWDAKTGEQLMVLNGHDHVVRDATFSPDGGLLATVSDDLTLRLWDPPTGRELRVLRANGSPSISVREVVFSPDGSLVTATWGDPVVRIWSVPDGDLAVELRGHIASVRLVRFSPDGGRVATAGFDNTARIWDVATGAELAVLLGHEHLVHEVSFSPDGEKLATSSQDGTVRVWDARRSPPDEACVSGRVERLDFRENGVGHPGGARIEIQHDSKQAILYRQAERGMPQGLALDHKFAVAGGRFSSDGKLLVTGSGAGWMGAGEARIFDAETGELLNVIPANHAVLAGARFMDGSDTLALAWSHGPLEFRDWDSGEIQIAFEGHAGSVATIAYSHDLSRLATSSSDATVRIWDAATGEQVTVLRGHEAPVLIAVFSPDGRHVVSGSRLGTLRLWNSDTGEELLTRLEAYDVGGGHLGFTSDGHRVVSVSASGGSRSWPVDIISAANQRQPRELTPAERRAYAVWDPGEEEALQLVEQLFDEKVLAMDVLSSLQTAEDLSEAVREAALRFTGLQEDNATMLRWAGQSINDRSTHKVHQAHIRGDPEERGRQLLAAAKRLRELEARQEIP
jgi:WD40 repeat protein